MRRVTSRFETARKVADTVLEQAGQLTTGQLAARLRRLVVALDPDQAQERMEQAVEERRVVTEPTPEGAADLMILSASPEQVQMARDRIERIAQALKSQDDTRTIDQIRADVALDLLCYGDTATTRATKLQGGGRVELRVDLSTLIGLSDEPAELAGFGPVVADLARQVAPIIKRWEYVVTHPDTGEVLHTGVVRRRPTASQVRLVRAQHPRCSFSGCRMPAIDCDIDHRKPYSEGGPTVDCNLTPLCRFHHRIRHQAGWGYTPSPDGDHIWESPLGHTYIASGRSP